MATSRRTRPKPLGELVGLFKALADPTRLRMVGLMVAQDRCGQELANLLRVSPPTISHHLQLLREAGLLQESRQSPYTFYRLDLAKLQKALRQVSDRKGVLAFARDTGLPEEKRKVLRSFFDGPRLLTIPAQRRKREIVLEEILRRLPRRRSYLEKELSRWIGAIHPDFCTLRREFIMGKYMSRARGRYQLTEKGRSVLAER
jgi:biotin operon repressor